MVDLSRLTGDEKLFCAHVDDMIQRCEKTYTAQFTHFLDERQALVARQTLARAGWQNFLLYGGYEGAERCVLGVFPPYEEAMAEEFPLCPITFTYRGADSLSHRDFLGSLMALQLKRESLGDIVVEQGRTVVFALPAAAAVICSEVKKVGAVGVKVSQSAPGQLTVCRQFQAIGGTVSSLRLDCVVALVTRLSREKAAQLIRSGLVMLDFVPCLQVDRLVKEGDRMSIRGHGKYIVGGSDGLSKKGRIRITVQKYV